MITRAELESARAFVGKVLSGEITPETRPLLFEEDLVYFNVQAVEKYDPAWLLEQLADDGYPLSGRREVLGNLHDLQEAGAEALKRSATKEE